MGIVVIIVGYKEGHDLAVYGETSAANSSEQCAVFSGYSQGFYTALEVRAFIANTSTAAGGTSFNCSLTSLTSWTQTLGPLVPLTGTYNDTTPSSKVPATSYTTADQLYNLIYVGAVVMPTQDAGFTLAALSGLESSMSCSQFCLD